MSFNWHICIKEHQTQLILYQLKNQINRTLTISDAFIHIIYLHGIEFKVILNN